LALLSIDVTIFHGIDVVLAGILCLLLPPFSLSSTCHACASYFAFFVIVDVVFLQLILPGILFWQVLMVVFLMLALALLSVAATCIAATMHTKMALYYCCCWWWAFFFRAHYATMLLMLLLFVLLLLVFFFIRCCCC
jgi:hypothetical protein